MSLDLTGIFNVKEFYSHHYMDTLLEGDIKGLISTWQEADREGNKPPDKRLAALSQLFFDMRARVREAVNPEDRFEEGHALHVNLLEALGYDVSTEVVTIEGDKASVALLVRLARDGRPYLWALEVPFPPQRKALTPGNVAVDDEVQESSPDSFWQERQIAEQLSRALGEDLPPIADYTLEDLPARLFATDDPPRWVLLLAGGHLVLADRTRWAQGKHLLFDLDAILGRKETDTLRAAAILLSRDALAPDQGTVLHDTLDENSHKHAYAVSEDLKYGVRRSVELLANEYIWYQRNVAKKKLFFDREDRATAKKEAEKLAKDLTKEGLRYLYRLLFLFYAEARGGELGVVPMNSEEYLLGYSLESLRDLEQVPLTTDEALEGTFLYQSLEKLFDIVNEGYGDAQTEMDFTQQGQSITRGFSIEGLRAPLFGKKDTPLFSSVKFRNKVLQEVLQLLSLSRERTIRGKGRRKAHKQRGRISYAQLGINQLGAVYEGLLSYSGFFAHETLYEVKPADADADDEKVQTYFVPEAELERYKSEEMVVDIGEDGEKHRRRYERGAFIFRLAGRDREKSASYYTPEVLTRCLVKYALKELIKEDGSPDATPADDILGLTICEPAMGSGAFLNEAINQLSDAYLRRKQKEIGITIPPTEYRDERQKVKAFIATRNCYGVDLNPVAVELAKVSLWLNTIYRGSQAPWFGPKLAVGNSLIGARRAVYSVAEATAGKWWEKEPKAVPLGKERPKNTIYHFLLPDGGMAPFDNDKVVKGLVPDAIKKLTEWRKEFVKKLSKDDARLLVRLSDAVDRLWAMHLIERRGLLRRTDQFIPLWGQDDTGGQSMPIEERQQLMGRLHESTSAYSRLNLVMDYWCALWFWPLKEVDNLPSRDEAMMDLQLVLEGSVTTTKPQDKLDLWGKKDDEERLKKLLSATGIVNIDELTQIPRLAVVQKVANRSPFHHFELEFAEIFAENGGFDLIVGNPPWVKVEWQEGGVLSDMEPLISLRNRSAKKIADLRAVSLKDPSALKLYLEDFEGQTATKGYLCAYQAYPLLKGIQTNLYKCFITRAWENGSKHGVSGFIHREAPYDDPKGGIFRLHLYPRIATHFHFRNELQLFAEIGNAMSYSLNVYRSRPRKEISFQTLSYLFHPSIIDRSYAHDGHGAVPGIKTTEGNWELTGHRSRIVNVNKDRLRLFAKLYDPQGTDSLKARLPIIYSEEIVSVLEKYARQPLKLEDLKNQYFATEMWHETNTQKDGTIKRETRVPKGPEEWILSGPHFYVATPFNKTPNEGCKSKGDYTPIDLTQIPDDYLPRTNYVPACSPKEYQKRVPKWNGRPVMEHPRLVLRAMILSTAERSLIAALVSSGTAHINSLYSYAFHDDSSLLSFSGFCFSIVADFFVRSTGKQNLHEIPRLLPIVSGKFDTYVFPRCLRLNCVSIHYSDFWSKNWKKGFNLQQWAKADSRLSSWQSLAGIWKRECAIRTHYERRQALVELDALAALALDLTEDELITIYRVGFAVLQQYERDTWYDKKGMIVFTVNKGLPGVGLSRKDFELWQESLSSNRELPPDFDTQGFKPPFDRCDREADMRQAYRFFAAKAKKAGRS